MGFAMTRSERHLYSYGVMSESNFPPQVRGGKSRLRGDGFARFATLRHYLLSCGGNRGPFAFCRSPGGCLLHNRVFSERTTLSPSTADQQGLDSAGERSHWNDE